ncbi:LOW QUALITY PROTEIN: hypothetical protein U9M48_023034 [Paspalum notatum var. saurae]|uniref:Uncharacterized protein n=1 Tax=Paspalum notatum var. saurae TaxID=547442 RepID=A0AAQ3TN75_PASNO
MFLNIGGTKGLCYLVMVYLYITFEDKVVVSNLSVVLPKIFFQLHHIDCYFSMHLRHDQLAQEHHENVVRGLENDEFFFGRGKNQKPILQIWGSHHKTLCRLQLMWQAVLEVLENICDDGPTSATKTCAAGLLKHMKSFEFVLIMHLMIKLLGKTNDLSQCLQKKDTNIVRALSLIGVTLQKVNDLREHGWEGVFEATKQFCVKHHIIVPDMSETTVGVVRGVVEAS